MKTRTKFKELFGEIETIDGIYFVVRAPHTRLTARTRYVFNAILDLFGYDMAQNIFLICTFADGKKPPALRVAKEMGMTYFLNCSYIFNCCLPLYSQEFHS